MPCRSEFSKEEEIQSQVLSLSIGVDSIYYHCVADDGREKKPKRGPYDGAPKIGQELVHVKPGHLVPHQDDLTIA